MAFLNETFDVNELPQGNTGDFLPLPEGWYNVKVVGAELKNTKDGTGAYIAVRYDVQGPTHQGRVVFGNINIRNKSEKAEEIGRQQLGDLMRASGLAKVSDTDQLVGAVLSIKLAIRTSEQYGDNNEVKAFKAVEGSRPPASVGAASVGATGSAKAKPAWAK